MEVLFNLQRDALASSQTHVEHAVVGGFSSCEAADLTVNAGSSMVELLRFLLLFLDPQVSARVDAACMDRKDLLV